MEKNGDRLKVIENIKEAISNKKFNTKVELNDHVITEEERKNVILNYDGKKRKLKNKVKNVIARSTAETITRKINHKTKIIGIENIENIKNTGAIITSNHFSPLDNTILRYLMIKISKKNKFDIIVQDNNIFMPGILGWLLKNNRTIPINKNHNYILNNFEPTVKEVLDKKHFVLIYPEEEMWFNYKKPRPGKIGAYHYACKYNVPIIPCFIEMRNSDKIDKDGFYSQNYTLHVMPPIYPNNDKDFKSRKEEMREQDYQCRVQKYEEVYGKKLDYSFEYNDIAGWN